MSLPTLFFYLSAAKLAFGVWLFSRRLPRRDVFAPKACGVLALAFAATVMSNGMGFSLFPPLTDDASFFRAIATFLAVLILAVFFQMTLWDCSAYSAIFCCSMAYMLENMSSAAERFINIYVGQGGNSAARSSVMLPEAFPHLVLYLTVTAIAYGIAYLSLVRKLEKNGLSQIDDARALIVAVTVITVNIVFDLVVKDLGSLGGIPRRYNVALSLIYLMLCSFVMYAEYEIVYVKRLQTEVSTIAQLRASEAERYRISRANVEAINARVHDIRHQLFRTLSSSGTQIDRKTAAALARDIDVFDAAVHTGNDTLDTVLSEKSLRCANRGITLGCIVDGASLLFMQPADLYALFDNALDQSIAAVEELSDPQRRSISLIVKRKGDMVTIHVENYFNGRVRLGDDGLPLSRESGYTAHGRATRSMMLAVEPYDGTLMANTQGDEFRLDALIPIPEGCPRRDA